MPRSEPLPGTEVDIAHGYYDVTVTADTGDGFTRRYAGRIA
jgi:hypothetical protein